MEQSELLAYVANAFASLGVEYFITGGLAATVYGEPRFTNDIDLVARLRRDHVAGLLNAFPMPEFYVSESAVEQAIRDRFQFNIIHPASGLKIDVIVPDDGPFEEQRRARIHRISMNDELEICFASPEDVILRKMQYYAEGGSEKHLRDIAGVLLVQGAAIQRDYIQKWADLLGVSEVWDVVARRVDHG